MVPDVDVIGFDAASVGVTCGFPRDDEIGLATSAQSAARAV